MDENSPRLMLAEVYRPLPLVIWTVFLLAFSSSIYRLYAHPLRKVPGPFLARITEIWRTVHYFRGTWFDDILELHRKYGPVVRISPNEVSVVSPDLTKTIYSHGKGTAKTNWYDIWAAGGDLTRTYRGVFDTTDPKEHGFLRKRVSKVYSLSFFVSMEPKVQGVMNSLWERFDEFEQKEKIINLSDWVSFFTYDVVATLCYGEPLGFIQKGADDGKFIQNIHEGFYWAANLGYILPINTQKLVFNLIPGFIERTFGLEMSNSFASFSRFAGSKINERRESPSIGSSDMLDHFLDMKDLEGKQVKDIDVFGEVGNLLAAGADTTSVGIKAVLGPILRDAKRYRRLQSELDDAYEVSGIAPGQPISYNILKDLPFLQACVKEGTRLHPSIVYQLPRHALESSVQLEGFFIDPSSTISMSPLAQNRCQAIFGSDADEWKPERWIPNEINTEEQIRFMDKNMATFGYGSRTCIGRNLATVEMTKFLAEIVARYDIKLLNEAKPWSIHSQWFAEIHNMMILLHKRGGSVNTK
ncbi:cytochrome P450 [Xylaria arbuscula]|nr:cytochrome P450 [Xylaria arbuscula]